jgi:uncharacterized ferritin-like protein (DUF455 family)
MNEQERTINPDWNPFCVAPPQEYGDLPRSLNTLEGIGDRLRSAAFAEIQAREAFRWAADHFGDALPGLPHAWRSLADAEQKHLDWLLKRMNELEISIQARKVSDLLWHSLIFCKSAEEFSHFMANAEERGRKAGVRFHQALFQIDPITAKIFGKIADEEVGHIALAHKFYPLQPGTTGRSFQSPSRLAVSRLKTSPQRLPE